MKKGHDRGKASNTRGGSKPAVAFKAERHALENIQFKLDGLKAALDAANHGKTYEGCFSGLPTTVRQFNRWKITAETVQGTSSDLVRQRGCRSNSNDTLQRYPDLVASVSSAVAAVRVLAGLGNRGSTGSESRGREQRLASARRGQRIDRALREIAERALVKAWHERLSAMSEARQLQARIASLEKAATQELAELAEKIAVLETRNAQLAEMLKKVVPLKRL